MNVVSRLLNVLFPLKCPVCGTLTEGESARLCPDCIRKLEEETALCCPLCGETADACRCLPESLSRHCTELDGRTHLCVGFYSPGKTELVLSRLIYSLKQCPDDAASRIAARMLAAPLSRLLHTAGEDPRQWTVVYPPRSAAKKAEMGFDHAERLTKHLAKALGTPRAHAFRRRGGKEQKTLNEQQRYQNIHHSLKLCHPKKYSGQKILLVDDVLTSGATLSHCAELLRKAGAEKVFCVTVLKTLPRRHKKRTNISGKFWFEEEEEA